MMLSGEAIRESGMVQNAAEENFRNASYNLRIGKIITLAGEEVTEYIVPPQGMAEVISMEKVRLPEDIAGYALVKTGLCNQGVLALNIGIVDPGYDGLISSTLINFSKSRFVLRQGDVFLRLTFHRYEPQSDVVSAVVNDEMYLADKKDKVRRHFSERFLDVDNTVEEVTKPVMERVLDEWKKRIWWWVPVAAFGFALLSFFVNFGATWSARWMLVDKAQLKADVLAEVEKDRAMDLDERVRRLEERLRQPAPPAVVPPPPVQQKPPARQPAQP